MLTVYDAAQLAKLADLGPNSAKARNRSDNGLEGLPTTFASRVIEPQQSVLICFREALNITGVSKNTLYRLVNKGAIPGVRKLGGTWRFHRRTLLDWLACKRSGTHSKKSTR